MDWKKLRDKEWLYEVIFGNDTPLGKTFDITVMVAIVVSIFITFIESMPFVAGHYKTALEVTEGILTWFFTIEYIARLYCSPVRRDYALSFFGIIDLLATMPPYLAFFFPSARYMLLLRTFRLIRVFRVFKLFSFINEGYLLLEVDKEEHDKDRRLFPLRPCTRHLSRYGDVHGRGWSPGKSFPRSSFVYLLGHRDNVHRWIWRYHSCHNLWPHTCRIRDDSRLHHHCYSNRHRLCHNDRHDSGEGQGRQVSSLQWRCR